MDRFQNRYYALVSYLRKFYYRSTNIMNSKEEIMVYLKELDRKLLLRFPEISAQIAVYERKLAEGTLTKNPIPGPQFND